MSLDITANFYFCPYPVYLDTYKGCPHNCAYCYVRKTRSIDMCDKDLSINQLKDFIAGKRPDIYNFLDDNIPICFGVMSDPFPKEVERRERLSFKALEVFKDTQHPVIISTKSDLILDDEYFEVLKDCNFVLRVSLTSKKFAEKFERGINNYEKRLEVLRKYKGYAKKLIVRPTLMTDYTEDIIAQIPELSEIGVDRICIMSLSAVKQFKNSERSGNQFVYKKEAMESSVIKIKNICDKLNIEFSCSDGRFAKYTDQHPACCVGHVDGFVFNKAQMNSYMIDAVTGSNWFSFSERQ